MKSKFVEEVGASKIRASVWKEALARHGGNIARTSEEFGFSKQRGQALTREHDLLDFARELRVSSGQPARGRPRIEPVAADPQVREKEENGN